MENVSPEEVRAASKWLKEFYNQFPSDLAEERAEKTSLSDIGEPDLVPTEALARVLAAYASDQVRAAREEIERLRKALKAFDEADKFGGVKRWTLAVELTRAALESPEASEAKGGGQTVAEILSGGPATGATSPTVSGGVASAEARVRGHLVDCPNRGIPNDGSCPICAEDEPEHIRYLRTALDGDPEPSPSAARKAAEREWTTTCEEEAAIAQLMEKQGLSRSAVLRPALRTYQLLALGYAKIITEGFDKKAQEELRHFTRESGGGK